MRRYGAGQERLATGVGMREVGRWCARASLIISLASAFGALPAEAQLAFSEPYGRIGFGGALSEKIKGDLVTLAYGGNGGFGGDLGQTAFLEVAAGATTFFGLRTELSVLYHFNLRVSNSASDPLTGASFSARSSDMNNATMLANVFYDFRNPSDFTPFVGIGVGVAFNHMGGVSYSTAGLNSSENGSDQTNFAFAPTAGLAYRIGPRIETELLYRYLDAGKFRTGGTVTSGPNNAVTAQTPVEAEFKAHEFEIGLRVTF